MLSAKKVFVLPVDNTTAAEAVKGMQAAIMEMGPPKEVYTDDGGEFKGAFARYLDEQQIEHLVTRRHAMFAERFTRYLRWHLNRQQRFHDEDWVTLLPTVVGHYNKGTRDHKVHSITGVTPNEGHKDENSLEVKLGMIMHHKRDRTYPPLQEGDKVKIYVKKQDMASKKEIVPHWTKQEFTISAITFEDDREYFQVNPRPRNLKAKYMRHELLKVG